MDTTAPASGGKRFSSGLQPQSLAIFATLLALVPLVVVVVLPWIIREAFLALGWLLRQGTEGRRSQLAALMDEDDRKYREQKMEPNASLSENDRDAQNAHTGALGNADETQRDWDGFVGFFHPFW